MKITITHPLFREATGPGQCEILAAQILLGKKNIGVLMFDTTGDEDKIVGWLGWHTDSGFSCKYGKMTYSRMFNVAKRQVIKQIESHHASAKS